MRIGKSFVGIAGGLAFATLFATLLPAEYADAAKRRRRRGNLALIDMNVGEFAGIRHNHVIEFSFSASVSQSTVHPANFQIRAENDAGTREELSVDRPVAVSSQAIAAASAHTCQTRTTLRPSRTVSVNRITTAAAVVMSRIR